MEDLALLDAVAECDITDLIKTLPKHNPIPCQHKLGFVDDEELGYEFVEKQAVESTEVHVYPVKGTESTMCSHFLSGLEDCKLFWFGFLPAIFCVAFIYSIVIYPVYVLYACILFLCFYCCCYKCDEEVCICCKTEWQTEVETESRSMAEQKKSSNDFVWIEVVDDEVISQDINLSTGELEVNITEKNGYEMI